MVRLILELIALIAVVGGLALFFNYIIFFWVNKRRLWKKEDEAFNTKKKQEALQELIETQNLLNESRETYVDWDKSYKLKDTAEELRKQ